MGFKARVYEAGGGVGGTWYWNRYPGARFDLESWTYGFSFSPEVLKEWDWKEHFSGQPENLRYCEFLADKFDLRRDITFNTRVKAAHWDEAANEWEVTFEDGGRARARFLITAIGPLSSPTMPTIPGIEDFKGESWHTGLWPHRPVSFEGKKVAVIGTGAPRACRPSPRSPRRWAISPCSSARPTGARRCVTAASNPRRWPTSVRAMTRSLPSAARTGAASVHTADPRHSTDVTPEEREAFFEKLYNLPGLRLLAGQFP